MHHGDEWVETGVNKNVSIGHHDIHIQRCAMIFVFGFIILHPFVALLCFLPYLGDLRYPCDSTPLKEAIKRVVDSSNMVEE